MNFELRVKRLLEDCGYHVIKKGKGFDLLAIKGDIALVIECKDWNRNITGKTLRRIVRKLRAECRKIENSYLLRGKTVIPILVTSGGVDSYRTDVRILTFEELRSILE